MSTNSADPSQLVGFSQSLDGVVAAALGILEQTAWAMARYQRDCAELPLETAATSQAADAIDQVRVLTTGTRRIAAAFEAADRGRGGGGLRTVDDSTFLAALATVARRHGDIDSVTEAGLVVDGERDLSIGPDGLTGTLAGSVLLGYRTTHSFDREFGPVSSHHELEAMVGAELSGEASATIGRDGVDVQVKGEAFVGAKGTASTSWTLGPCTATGEGTVAAGAGVSGELDGHIGADGFRVDGGLLTTLGVGGGVSGSLSCGVPSWDETKAWWGDRADDIDEGLDAAGDALVDGLETIGSGIEDGIGAIGDGATAFGRWLR